MATDDPGARLAAALELADAGIALQRQNLRRRHPTADDDEIDRLLQAWLEDRPPDAPGRIVVQP